MYIMNILLDKDGVFQWASIAALVSFIAARSSKKNSEIQKEIAKKI